jgi:O-6-methylguanine DNA methyltransferase
MTAQHESECQRQVRVSTSWGDARLVVHGDAVVRIEPPYLRAGEQGARAARDLAALPDAASDPHAAVRECAVSLAQYFAGNAVEFVDRATLSHWLDIAGVEGFRRDVSLALADVPRGVTISYGELATLAGRPGAARAAGSACARNPLPLVVPCHRVVHAGARHGDVGSYGAGSGPDTKRRLLQLEDAALVR